MNLNVPHNDTTALSIILVDDDPEDRDFFEEVLKKIDYGKGLRSFSSGMLLLDYLNTTENLPEMLFLDLIMPAMDGQECLAKIRSDPRFDKIPIIIYSTAIDMTIIDRLFKIGANRYLRKPYTFQGLEKALRRTISSIQKNPRGGNAIINVSYGE